MGSAERSSLGLRPVLFGVGHVLPSWYRCSVAQWRLVFFLFQLFLGRVSPKTTQPTKATERLSVISPGANINLIRFQALASSGRVVTLAQEPC